MKLAFIRPSDNYCNGKICLTDLDVEEFELCMDEIRMNIKMLERIRGVEVKV